MKRKANILVVGSFVMDLTASADRFVQAGETILGNTFTTASGGKGANQATQVALLGANVVMVGKVGNDSFGKEMITALQTVGVDTHQVMTTNEVSSGVGHVQIQCNEQGTQNRIVVIPGANAKITKEDIAYLKDDIKKYDLVMLQLEIPMEINEQVAQYAYDAGVAVMLNSAPSAPLSDSLLQHLTFISPNEHEAEDMVGFPIRTDAEAEKAIHALLAKGVKNVLITRGSQGASYGDGTLLIHAPCVFCEHVVDPTAAGDSFVAAFCTGIASGLSASDALILANHTAHITVTRMGAQPSLPRLDEVFALLESRQVDISPYALLR